MTIDTDEFLARSGIDMRLLQQWIEREWLRPDRRDAALILSELDAARARLIRDLKGDFGINDEGVEIVLHLVDQIHGLRRVLMELRRDMRTTRRSTIRRTRVRKVGQIAAKRRRP